MTNPEQEFEQAVREIYGSRFRTREENIQRYLAAHHKALTAADKIGYNRGRRKGYIQGRNDGKAAEVALLEKLKLQFRGEDPDQYRPEDMVSMGLIEEYIDTELNQRRAE